MHNQGAARGCGRWVALLICFAGVVAGCRPPQVPLSPAAASFKKEMRGVVAKLAPALSGPVSQGDVAAIHRVLKKLSAEAAHAGKPWSFRIGMLDRNGIVMAAFPPPKETGNDFSHYELVAKVLKDHRTVSQRFYMQDDSQLFVICAPLLQQDNAVGVLALIMNAQEVEKKWGITEKELLAIDFN